MHQFYMLLWLHQSLQSVNIWWALILEYFVLLHCVLAVMSHEAIRSRSYPFIRLVLLSAVTSPVRLRPGVTKWQLNQEWVRRAASLPQLFKWKGENKQKREIRKKKTLTGESETCSQLCICVSVFVFACVHELQQARYWAGNHFTKLWQLDALSYETGLDTGKG